MSKKSIVSNVINRIKQIARSKEVRALIAHELEDDCGMPTKAGRQLVLRRFAEKQWADERLEIGKQLVAVKKDEKEEREDNSDSGSGSGSDND